MQEIINETSSTQTTPVGNLSKSLPIRAFLMACVRNWYWFLISIVTCGCIAFLYGKSQSLMYESKALIILTTKDSNQGTQAQAFSDLGITGGTNYMPNEIYKIRSTDLLETVVKNMGINIQYYGHVFLRDVQTSQASRIFWSFRKPRICQRTPRPNGGVRMACGGQLALALTLAFRLTFGL